MQITVEDLSMVKKKINFEIPAERVDSEIGRAYEKIRKAAAVPGFRKGKAPLSYLEKHFSAQMTEDVLKSLVNDTYFKAIMDLKILPVAYPLIESDDLKKGEAFRYTAIVEIFPEIVVSDFEGLQVEKEKYVFAPEVIDQRLAEMQQRAAQLKHVDDGRLAALGDFTIINFAGFVDGEAFDGGTAEDFQLELGSGRFIPGFEDQLVGMKVEEEKEIAVTFPADYNAPHLAGKPATFKVKLTGLKVKEVPALDDDFAAQMGDFATLDELKAKMAEVYESQEKARIEGELREKLVAALIERNPVEVPDTLIDRQLEMMLENAKQRLQSQRLSLEMMGMSEEQYKLRFRTNAEVQVKGALLLEALAKQLNVTVEDADLQARYRELAEQNGQEVEVIEKYYLRQPERKEGLAHQLREEKAVDFLSEKAIVTEVEKKRDESPVEA